MTQQSRRPPNKPATVGSTIGAAPPGLTGDHLVRDKYDSANERDIFAKVYEFTMADQARELQIYPFFQPLDSNDGPEGQIFGRKVLMFGSNNYLGLTRHPYVIESAREAITRYGSSMTGSRLLNGSTHLHEELEGRIARFVRKEAAFVTTTGYLANLGSISALVNKRSVAVVDKADHASIYDGCALSDGDMVRFRHNDVAHLDAVLKRINGEKAALVIIDGIYSMGGDIAPLPEIIEVCRRYEARLLVDDAHAIGVIGDGGRGTGSHFGLDQEVDLVMGTFSKSLASIGGFFAGARKVVDWIRHFGRPLVFSASLPPASVAAALAALDVLEREPERVEQLKKISAMWRDGIAGLGVDIGPTQSPIVPIKVGDTYTTVMFWKALVEEGLYTNPVLYPAVPMNETILRTSCMATHTPENVEQALEIVRTVGRRQGLLD